MEPDLLDDLGESRRELLGEPGGAALRLADRQLAKLDASAGHHALAERVGTGAEVECLELADQLIRTRSVHVEDHELLLRGSGDAPIAAALGEVGNEP